jgi:hypothetical protein
MAKTLDLAVNEQPKAKRGRPPIYGQEVKDRIIDRVANGDSLNEVLKVEGISPGAFYKWLSDEEFRESYTNARKIQAEIMASEILKISDEVSRETYKDEKGRERIDFAAVARARLMVDTRKWILAKVLPKVYGDRLAVTDADGQSLNVNLSWLTGRRIGTNGKGMSIDVTDVEEIPGRSITYEADTADSKSESEHDDGQQHEQGDQFP